MDIKLANQDISIVNLKDKFLALSQSLTYKENQNFGMSIANFFSEINENDFQDIRISEGLQAGNDYINGIINFDEFRIKKNACIYAIQDMIDDGQVVDKFSHIITAAINSLSIYDEMILHGYSHENSIAKVRFSTNVTIEHMFKLVEKNLTNDTFIKKLNVALNETNILKQNNEEHFKNKLDF
jgi:hypothetical protein